MKDSSRLYIVYVRDGALFYWKCVIVEWKKHKKKSESSEWRHSLHNTTQNDTKKFILN